MFCPLHASTDVVTPGITLPLSRLLVKFEYSVYFVFLILKKKIGDRTVSRLFQFCRQPSGKGKKTAMSASSGHLVILSQGILGDFYPIQNLHHRPGQLQPQYCPLILFNCGGWGLGTDYGDIGT